MLLERDIPKGVENLKLQIGLFFNFRTLCIVPCKSYFSWLFFILIVNVALDLSPPPKSVIWCTKTRAINTEWRVNTMSYAPIIHDITSVNKPATVPAAGCNVMHCPCVLSNALLAYAVRWFAILRIAIRIALEGIVKRWSASGKPASRIVIPVAAAWLAWAAQRTATKGARLGNASCIALEVLRCVGRLARVESAPWFATLKNAHAHATKESA